jgi:lipoprotein NlpI
MADNLLNSILNWLKSTEMFARPSKQIPGKWELFEYYIESGNELHNLKKTQLKENNEFWKIEFTNECEFIHENNLPVWQISKVNNGNWNISKNFITLSSSENIMNYIEFQFALEKETLKLLKKDALGRIEFFGFFNRVV